MNPTLAEPELVEVSPYAGRNPRVGDVIYFRLASGDRDIIHRLMAIGTEGLRTRGDDSPSEDDWLLQPHEIIGRVVAAQRGTSRRAILGGRAGLYQHFFLRVRRQANRAASRILHRPYRFLARLNFLRACLPAGWRPRVIVFRDRTRLLMFRKRVIGRHEAGWENWRISRPFRLIVDESVLPKS